MLKTSTIAAFCILSLGTTSALSAEPILGKWRAPGGGIVDVTDCSGSFCATVISGKHKGKSVGTMSGAGGTYTGTVTDPRDDRTYDGTATVNGGGLTLRGCALRIFCRNQHWTRV